MKKLVFNQAFNRQTPLQNIDVGETLKVYIADKNKEIHLYKKGTHNGEGLVAKTNNSNFYKKVVRYNFQEAQVVDYDNGKVNIGFFTESPIASSKKNNGCGKYALIFFGVLALLFVIVAIIDNDNTPTDTYSEPVEETSGKTVDQLKKEYKIKDSLMNIGLNRLKELRKESDEFSTSTFYYDKRTPKYVNQNFVYPYIGQSGGFFLRLKMQYYADDWLFIKNVKISADGKLAAEFNPVFDRDNNTMIWEWADVLVPNSELSDLWKIANAKKAVIRYEGMQYHDDRALTAKEKSILKKTIEIYRLLKGIPAPIE